MAKRVRLALHLCPGDSLVLSAAIRSLHLNYPGAYLVDVDCTARELFANNPDVVRLDGWDSFGEVHYDAINRSNDEPIHFMSAMCQGVSKIVGRPVPLKVNKPVLILSDDEKQWSGPLLDIAPEPVPFAVILSGFKRDFTCKGFGPVIAQQVVDHFRDRLLFVQVGTSNELHTPLKGVVNLIDRTTIRQLCQIANRSVFGVGPVTFLMHAYAALEKPYICMAGGREPKEWNSYHTNIQLSTIGMLPCCRTRACWCSRVVPLNDGCHDNDKMRCSLPVLMSDDTHVPACHVLQGADGIIGAAERVLMGGGHEAALKAYPRPTSPGSTA